MTQSIFSTADKVYTYQEFLDYAQNKIAQDEAHPELIEDEKYAHYTKLNFQRMKRWNKTFTPDAALIEDLKKMPAQQWWLITEAWCGDSAQNLPALAKIAETAQIPLHIVLRDQNLPIIDQYLTNGTRSIPVLVSFDEKGDQLFRWGPRPASAHEIMMDWKANPGDRSFEDIEMTLHQWYTKDQGAALQQELKSIAQAHMENSH